MFDDDIKYLLKKNTMKIILLLILFFSTNCFSQIKIDDVGEGWKKLVELSLKTIETVDNVKYKEINNVCDRIGFWNGNYSTTEGNKVILISKKDIEYGNINNIMAIIIHESRHLYFRNNNIFLNKEFEEILCYKYELDFLQKLPEVEEWLIEHSKKMINYYQELFYNKH
jgi:hypothetical protein